MREEDLLQSRCVAYLRDWYPKLLLNHSPNEGKRSEYMGATLKRMGMLAGYPDLEVISKEDITFIEFKTPKGRQSQSQKDVQLQLEALGYEYIICRTFEQFLNICHQHWGKEVNPDLDQLKKIFKLGQ